MSRVKVKAKIMWASTDAHNPMSNKFQIDLCDLSDKAVQAIEDMGITVNQKDGQGYFITCKSSKYPIVTYDADGQQLTGFPLKEDGSPSPQSIKIGNGSECVALIEPYTWKYMNKEGISPSAKKIVVTELVKYGGNDDTSVDDLLSVDEEEDEIL